MVACASLGGVSGPKFMVPRLVNLRVPELAYVGG
jgi:hypothetical protein